MQTKVIYQQNVQILSSCTNKYCQFQNSQFMLKLENLKISYFGGQINTQCPSHSTQISHILSGNRQVRPKMITRILTWLQKLCNQTMGFSTHTLQTAARILLKYLSIIDQPVCNLQLLGSTCLFLSSKIWQQTIVAAQSYVECSCNIFTKYDLMLKQAQVYKILEANTIYTCLYDIYQQISSIQELKSLISDQHNNTIKQYISYCIKDTQFLTFNTYQLMICIICYVVVEHEKTNGIQTIRNLIKNGCGLVKK